MTSANKLPTMMDYHWNYTNLPPISKGIWLWVRTDQGELLKVKRTAIIPNKDLWEWPVEDLRGNTFTVKVIGWIYS